MSGAVDGPPPSGLATKTRIWAAAVTAFGVVMLGGCADTPAQLAEGCYRFDDGTPFFRVAGRIGTFVDTSGLQKFRIGSWKRAGAEIEVAPAFLVHDGTVSAPAGPARMADAVTTLSSGIVRYRREMDQVILSIPVEAYGWLDVRHGESC